MDVSREAKKRLAALVEDRDEPLAALAVRIGVSQSTLWNFIYGETKNFSKLHRLASVLQVSLDWVQHGERASEAIAPAAGRFAEPAGVADNENLVRILAQEIAQLARARRTLSAAILGGIAVAAWQEAHSDGSAGRDAVIATMRRLATYEDGKSRRK